MQLANNPTVDTAEPEQFRHVVDPRSPFLKLMQSAFVANTTTANLVRFGVKPTQKSTVKYQSSKLLRADLGKGWFCHYTDSEHRDKPALITIHGCPGNHREWAGLEFECKGSFRWINFVVPGFDGIDQRRGDYRGTKQDLSQMILALLDYLKVGKFLICGHSMGSIFMPFLNAAAPKRVIGLISITGIVDYWYIGLVSFYTLAVTQLGITKGWDPKLNQDNQRAAICNRFRESVKEFNFEGVPFPVLEDSELCGYIKFINSYKSGLSQAFELYRSISPTVLQLLVFGQSDPLEQVPKVEATIYRIINSHRKVKVQEKLLDRILSKVKREFGVRLEPNLQANFAFLLEDTGHNAHKRRAQQLAKPLCVFSKVCEMLSS